MSAPRLTFGSLFSGIGGLDLGLERAGMTCRWQVEIDEYARAVLAKHWPDVKRYEDVRDVGAHNLAPVDLICGGFPCQDVSVAGKRAGLDGERSGLWFEFARIIRELRPRYALVENVPGLLADGMGRVLGELAEIGYDAEWDCIPAAAVGAPHQRDRVFLVAYPVGSRDDQGECLSIRQRGPQQAAPDAGGLGPAMADAGGKRRQQNAGRAHGNEGANEGRRAAHHHLVAGDGEGDLGGEVSASLADTEGLTARRLPRRAQAQDARARIGGEDVANPERDRLEESRHTRVSRRAAGAIADDSQWATEPDVGRVAYGVPGRVDRLRGLGNAVVPQVAEAIGRMIMEAAA